MRFAPDDREFISFPRRTDISGAAMSGDETNTALIHVSVIRLRPVAERIRTRDTAIDILQ